MERVLLLSPYPERLSSVIAESGCEVLPFNGNVNNDCPEGTFDCVVSYGYRHVIRAPFLQRFAGRVMNLHVALLPWNRGADPNFWSFFDNTPAGVSIHLVDQGLDTGPVLKQRQVQFADTSTLTLASSYELLQGEMLKLFCEFWAEFTSKEGQVPAVDQRGGGSFHKAADKDPFFETLSAGWNTPVCEVMDLGRKVRGHRG
jgi:methionyl-tRNA formyltransferase